MRYTLNWGLNFKSLNLGPFWIALIDGVLEMVPEVKEETATMLLIMGRLLPLRKTITFAFLYRASLSFILNCPYKWSHYFIYESRTNKHKSSYGDKYATDHGVNWKEDVPYLKRIKLARWRKCCGKEIAKLYQPWTEDSSWMLANVTDWAVCISGRLLNTLDTYNQALIIINLLV